MIDIVIMTVTIIAIVVVTIGIITDLILITIITGVASKSNCGATARESVATINVVLAQWKEHHSTKVTVRSSSLLDDAKHCSYSLMARTLASQAGNPSSILGRSTNVVTSY